MKLPLFLIIFSLGFFYTLHAQNIVSGNITDTSGQPIENVSITYRKINSTIVLGFTHSDQDGNFNLPVKLTEGNLVLDLKHLNYEGKSLVINNETKKYTFTLKQQVQLLPKVVVTGPPIYRQKDTINYNVSAFTSKEDRVIADIIRKLPGVEMDGDKILYQGKPIQKYYINGLDLLEGRYSLANNNLPIEAVQKVQIMENNQPIKILDSLIFSDRASLNIQLKKFTTTGTGKVGAGLSPFLWDVNLTPMTFSKTFQSINTLQTNNVGDDVSKQLTVLAEGSMFERMSSPIMGEVNEQSFLNIQEISSPSFNEKKWLDNHSNLFSSNVLKKLKNNLELKGNISYVNDYKNRMGQTFTTLFTPNQQIDIAELVDNSYQINDLRGNFILLKNEKNIYLKNTLSLSKKWLTDNGNLLRNDIENIVQHKTLENLNVANRFTAVTFLGKQLITLNSFINYNQMPQNLGITPGQFENILNAGIPYQKVGQYINFKNFKADHYISFVKGFKAFTLVPKLGITFQNQQLQSNLTVVNANGNIALGNAFQNQLGFLASEAYIDLGAQYKKQKWRIEVTNTLKFRNYTVEDEVSAINNKTNKLIYEPRMLAIYQFNSYWETGVSSSYAQNFGGINTLYTAYLLNSYRNIQRFNVAITQSNSWNSSLFVNYKNTLKTKFAGIAYTYSKQLRNYLFKNILDANGFNTVALVHQNNVLTAQNISGNYSKYFSEIKTILKVNGSVSFSKADYLFNNVQQAIKNKAYNATLSLNNNTLKTLSFTYETNVTVVNSFLAGNRLDKIFMNNHIANFTIFPINNQAVTFNGEYYITNLKSQKDQLFIDLTYRFSLPKRKIDLEASCLNLLNNNTYIKLYNSEFSIVRNYFQLRPRQLMLTTRFRF